ncbi:hypothetical protein [Georgenia subflava]|uniref:Uncharacterized protein n=1 Tax=Georgenia subflava TaxID=1622177 RepID=A0A6N7EP60_9MICO|nr:hypothetical protein [Georgenia subflava]MPV38647.1 hypothetical protein [Georgenia subflava]
MSATENTVLHRLSQLDPSVGEPPASPADSDSTLAWVLAQPRDTQNPPRRVSRLALAGVASATVLVAVASALWPSAAPPAFASWEPVPLALPRAATTESAARCPAGIPANPEGTETEAVTPVIAEQRGDYTFVLQAGVRGYQECFITDGVGTASGWDAMANSMSGPAPLPSSPAGTGLLALATGESSWGAGDGAGEGSVTTAYGMAGPEVESITITTASGRTAEASVTDGWWAVWIPGSDPIAGPVEVTSADGAVAWIELDDVTHP